MSNIKNIEGFRRCYLCDQTFSATEEYFPKDKNRSLGLGYQCKPCAKIKTKERSKSRPLRWQEMTEKQKDRKRNWQRTYAKSNNGWPRYRLGSYKYYDTKKGLQFDLTLEWFIENIFTKPCFYCQEIGNNGCDRIDNSLGHLIANVVPCCDICNTTRMDNFNHKEMIELGKVIHLIKSKRLLS